MEYNEIIALLKTGETLNEGLAELENFHNERNKIIEELKASNERYKETNANLAMKISAPIPDVSEEESEEEKAEKILNEWAKELN